MNFPDEFSPVSHSAHPIIRLDTVDSTNIFLEKMVKEAQISGGTVVLAEFQTAGKGMLNNTWESQHGKNLLISQLISPLQMPVADQFYLSKAISLGIRDYLELLLPWAEVKIKWPNDILVSGKKIAGILINCSLRGEDVVQSIVGIGLNVNQTIYPLQFNATSLILELGYECQRDLVLHYLLSYLDYRISQILEAKYSIIDSEYHRHISGLGVWRTYLQGNVTMEGRILEVQRDGRLLMEKQDGSREVYAIREISLIPA